MLQPITYALGIGALWVRHLSLIQAVNPSEKGRTHVPKRARLTVVIAIAATVLAACSGGSGESVVGRYVNEETSQDFLELKTDGSFFLLEDGLNLSGTYRVEGDQVVLTVPLLGDLATATIQGDTLVDDDGERWSKSEQTNSIDVTGRRTRNPTPPPTLVTVQPPAVALITGMSVAVSHIVRDDDIATIHFVLTKQTDALGRTSKRSNELVVTIRDDRDNTYTSTLALDFNGAPSDVAHAMPIGFSYSDTVSIGIPRQAPIESLQFGENPELAFAKLSYAPKFDPSPSSFQNFHDPVKIDGHLTATITEPKGDVIGWRLPIEIQNMDYNDRAVLIQLGLQSSDGSLSWSEPGIDGASILGSGKSSLAPRLLTLSQALNRSDIRAVLTYLKSEATGLETLAVVRLVPDDFGHMPERLVYDDDRVYATGNVSVLNMDEPEIYRISSGSGWTPDFSPDGLEIIYEGLFGRLYRTNADGESGQSMKGDEPRYINPVISPDGTNVVFTTARIYGRQSIAIATLELNDTVILHQFNVGTLGVRAPRGDPSWSNDGSVIVFDDGMNIYSVNVEGGSATELTEGVYPIWSPRNSTIAFIANGSLWLMDYGDCSTTVLAEGVTKTRPAWSPDGDRVAFVRGQDVYAVDIQAGTESIIAEGIKGVGALAWAPALALSDHGVAPVKKSLVGSFERIADGGDSMSTPKPPCLANEIGDFLTTLPPRPEYLLEPTSFTRAISSVWATFTDWATQTALTDSYSEFHHIGVNLDGLSQNAAIRAKRALDSGDVERAKELLNRALQFRLLSQQAFSAAATVFEGNLEAGQILADGIKGGSQSAVTFGLKFVSPLGAVAADYVYMATDYGIDSTLSGVDEANRSLLIRLVVKRLTQEIPFEHLGGATLAVYTKQITADQLRPVLEQLLQKEEARQAMTHVLAELVAQGLTNVTEQTAVDLLDQMFAYVAEVEVHDP